MQPPAHQQATQLHQRRHQQRIASPASMVLRAWHLLQFACLATFGHCEGSFWAALLGSGAPDDLPEVWTDGMGIAMGGLVHSHGWYLYGSLASPKL
eukprot:Skav223157  [mRNA]  locus=scaffold2973:132185:133873:- [translate_table: standard]